MRVVQTEVKTFVQELPCSSCVVGTMKPTGITLLSIPPQYPHKCNKCGAELTVKGHCFPRTITLPVNGTEEIIDVDI